MKFYYARNYNHLTIKDLFGILFCIKTDWSGVMDILFAIFGGAYYALKYAGEKAQSEIFQAKLEEAGNQMKNNQKYKSTPALEQRARYTPMEIICAQFNDDLVYAMGSNWQHKLKQSEIERKNRVSYDFVYRKEWIYRLVLASYGKVDDWRIVPLGKMRTGEGAKEDLRFAECVEKQLVKAGVTEIKFGLVAGYYDKIKRKRSPRDIDEGRLEIFGETTSDLYRLW